MCHDNARWMFFKILIGCLTSALMKDSKAGCYDVLIKRCNKKDTEWWFVQAGIVNTYAPAWGRMLWVKEDLYINKYKLVLGVYVIWNNVAASSCFIPSLESLKKACPTISNIVPQQLITQPFIFINFSNLPKKTKSCNVQNYIKLKILI